MKGILPRILLALAALGAWAAYESTQQDSAAEIPTAENIEILSESEGPLKTHIIAEHDSTTRQLSQASLKGVKQP